MADTISEAMEQISLEDINHRHRRERKELQAKIQALKKSVPKTDKKKRKEVMEEVARLEKEIIDRQKVELDAQQLNDDTKNHKLSDSNSIEDNKLTPPSTPTKEMNDSDNGCEQQESSHQRVSKAQKRRERKAREARQREENIRASLANDDKRTGPKMTEARLLNEKLKKRNLSLYLIESDGDCLYNAIRHQLQQNGQEANSVKLLRRQTAAYIRANKDSLICYMTHPQTGESLTNEEFDKYCNAVANTHAWGGHIELKALSSVLRVPIEVLQAEGPPTIQGDGEFKNPKLLITYHRHMYSLGEHYNSTQPKLNLTKEDTQSDEHDGEAKQ